MLLYIRAGQVGPDLQYSITGLVYSTIGRVGAQKVTRACDKYDPVLNHLYFGNLYMSNASLKIGTECFIPLV